MATLTNSDKNTVSATNLVKDKEESYLQREESGYLLLESLGRIVLVDHDFENIAKSPASLTNITKS